MVFSIFYGANCRLLNYNGSVGRYFFYFFLPWTLLQLLLERVRCVIIIIVIIIFNYYYYCFFLIIIIIILLQLQLLHFAIVTSFSTTFPLHDYFSTFRFTIGGFAPFANVLFFLRSIIVVSLPLFFAQSFLRFFSRHHNVTLPPLGLRFLCFSLLFLQLVVTYRFSGFPLFSLESSSLSS